MARNFLMILSRFLGLTTVIIVILFFVNRSLQKDWQLWLGPSGSRSTHYIPESWQDLLLYVFLLGGSALVFYLLEKAIVHGTWLKNTPGKGALVVGGTAVTLILLAWGVISYGNSMAAKNTGGKLLNAIADRATPEILLPFIKAEGQPGTTMSYNAFETAVMHDNLRVIPVLVENGYDINAQTRELYKNSGSGQTVLMRAAEAYSFNAVQTLLENGAKTDLKDSQGMTALHYAVKGFSEYKADNALLLINAGADANAQDNNGESALHYMLKNQFITEEDLEIIKFLVAADANLDLRDDNGQTPRKYAADPAYQYSPGAPEYYKELNALFKK